jgi:hypothetical protein
VAAFDRSVFVNCPFDAKYEPILQAILFCITYLGLTPRLATERMDSAENRLDKIREMIEASAYSIHDLSRAQAKRRGEFFRLNMPFELGIDYACRRYFGEGRDAKKILILEKKRYRHQASLSDMAGCDLQIHGGKYEIAVRRVRNWLVNEAPTSTADGPSLILRKYIDFQGWFLERQTSRGLSDDDIRDYHTKELLDGMAEWLALGLPVAWVDPVVPRP